MTVKLCVMQYIELVVKKCMYAVLHSFISGYMRMTGSLKSKHFLINTSLQGGFCKQDLQS